jgi:hypothetical protein
VPFGVRYFDGMRYDKVPPPPVEFSVAAPTTAGAAVEARYGDGWSPQQWDGKSTWRWARTGHATLALRNDTGRTVQVGVRFLARSREPRQLEVRAGSDILFAGELPMLREVIALPAFELPPGESTLVFSVSGPPGKADDDTPGEVTFRIETPQVTVAGP